MRRIIHWLREAWVMAGVALLGLCLLESVLTLAFYVDDRITWRPADERFNADAYDHASWPLDYYDEHAKSAVTRWEPYVYWRRLPYHGRFININDKGLRMTTPAAPDSGAPKIFMLGGSTMWGTGARDAFTIPSLVARELRRNGVAADVSNFGESGYVSTQSLLTLEHELRQGARPDLVVVYDGINDVYSAYQQRIAGWPQNEGNRIREFNQSLGDRFHDLARDLGQRSQTRRFLLHFTPASNARPETGAIALPPMSDDELARLVVRTFVSNMEMIGTLGKKYGFETLVFWQPTILDKSQLTTYEKVHRAQIKPMEPLFTRAYELVRGELSGTTTGIHDLSGIFAHTAAPVFVDFFHLGETGNEMVAKVMLPEILRVVKSPSTR